MGLVSLLFSFHGRINRAQYWGGTLGVAAVSFLMTIVVGVSTGLNAATADPAAALSASLGTLGFTTVVNILNCWCSLAIQVKRFHDRGRTGWLAAIPFVLLLWIVGALLGAAMSQLPPTQALSSLGLPLLLLFGVCLAFFIDLGCLPGKPDANKYGDPPGSAPGAGSPQRPSAAPSAGFSLGNAQTAMERAIASGSMSAAPQPAMRAQPAAAAMSGAPAAAPSFGRRPTA